MRNRNRNQKQEKKPGWNEGGLPLKHLHLFLSQRLTDGDGVGIEPDEVAAPQPREAREQRRVGWWRGHSSKKAVQLLVHLVEDAGAGLHLLLHGRGGGARGTGRTLLP